MVYLLVLMVQKEEERKQEAGKLVLKPVQVVLSVRRAWLFLILFWFLVQWIRLIIWFGHGGSGLRKLLTEGEECFGTAFKSDDLSAGVGTDICDGRTRSMNLRVQGCGGRWAEVREGEEEGLTSFAVQKVLKVLPVFGSLEALDRIELRNCHIRYGQSEVKPLSR